MAPLSSDLQGVLGALPSSIPKTLVSQYERAISASADALNEAGSCSETASLPERSTAVSKACKILFEGHTVTPESSSYKETQQKNWSTTCWLSAACFISIWNTVELALALKIVTRTQCKFAIRSGGHMSNEGFGGVDESGVVFDLGALNEITLSQNRDIVSVGPGATWGLVYEVLEKHELTVVGGRVFDVGVGGLVLGGGMSHFSNHWGLACDHVKNFEVVLADSTIVQANAKDNPDLFLALKGGGPNFGIVTRFDLYTNPDYRVWYTMKVYNSSDADRIFKAATEVQQAMEDDDRIGFFLSINVGFFAAGMLYRGQPTNAPSVFKAFDDITPMATPFPESHGTQFSVAKAFNMAGKKKRETGAISLKANLDLHSEIPQILCDIATSSSISLACTIQPIGASAVKKGQEVGGNSMNIPAEPQSWLAIMVEWAEDTDDVLARSQIRHFMSSVESTAKSRGLLLDFQFLNDSSHLQNPLKSYGSESLATLSEASQKWDSEGVFQRLQNSGFLLSKVAAS